MTITGSDPESMATLVKGVAYLNTREFPVPGRRITRLETRLNCRDGKTIHLESKRVDVDVIPVPEPTMTISGTASKISHAQSHLNSFLGRITLM